MAQASIDRKFESLIDPRLETNYDHEEMKRMIACAGACMHFFAEKRPHMSEVCVIFIPCLLKTMSQLYICLHSKIQISLYEL